MQKLPFRMIILVLTTMQLAGCAGAGPIKGPASQYLPYPVDLPGYLVENDNLGLERMVEQTRVRAMPEDSAFVNYDNNGYTFTTQPQNGVYLRLSYWVVVHRNSADAQSFYAVSNAEIERKNRLSVIMPSTIQQSIDAIHPVALNVPVCQESALYKIPSHVIFTPDLYLYAVCRVDNAVISLWAYTADNYDGNNTPIPDDVISSQMENWMGLALARIPR